MREQECEEAERYGALAPIDPDCAAGGSSSDGERSEADSEEDSEEEEDVVLRIDTASMVDLKRYYDQDGDVQTCRERQQEAARARASVGWWYEYGPCAFELRRLRPAQEEVWMAAVLDVLWRAQDCLNLFHFVGFYYERDIVGWLMRGAAGGDAPLLPFGLLPLQEGGEGEAEIEGEFVRIRRAGAFEWELFFECPSRSRRERYDFYIYSKNATFSPLVLSEEEERAREERLRAGRGVCRRRRRRGRRGAGRAEEGPADLSVNSPFIDLYRKSWGCEEAQLFAFHANFLATHPEPFLQCKEVPPDPLEDAPDEVRFTLDNVDKVRRENSERRMLAQSTAAKHYIANNLNGGGGAKGKGKRPYASQDMTAQWKKFRDGDSEASESEEETPVERWQREFDRPTLKQSLKPLPASMQISRGPPPTILLRPEELRRDKEDAVCNLMNFPHLFFKPHTSIGRGGQAGALGAKSSLSPADLEFSQRQLRRANALRERTFALLFGELYARTLGRLDRLFFAHLGAEAEFLTDHLVPRLSFEPSEEEEEEEEEKEKKKNKKRDAAGNEKKEGVGGGDAAVQGGAGMRLEIT